LCRAASFIFSAPGLKADNFAYAGLGNGSFGTIDLNTGVFTSVGNLGQTPAGRAVSGGSIFATSYGNGTLYQVDTTNGSLVGIPLTQTTPTYGFWVWTIIRGRSGSLKIAFRPKRTAGPIW
jgi:hypothetical protein